MGVINLLDNLLLVLLSFVLFIFLIFVLVFAFGLVDPFVNVSNLIVVKFLDIMILLWSNVSPFIGSVGCLFRFFFLFIAIF